MQRIDINILYVCYAINIEELISNSGPSKYFLGESVCRFHSKDILCAVTYSSRVEINQIISIKYLKKINEIEIHN